MSRPTSKPTSLSPFADLQREILHDRSSEAPPYSEGWRTIDEAAAELKICRDHAKVKLRAWLAMGRVERWVGKAPNRAGGLSKTVRYRRNPSYLNSGR